MRTTACTCLLRIREMTFAVGEIEAVLDEIAKAAHLLIRPSWRNMGTAFRTPLAAAAVTGMRALAV